MAVDYIQARLVLAMAAATALTGCARQTQPSLLSIEGSPRAFEEQFNAAKDSVRVVLLLSPT